MSWSRGPDWAFVKGDDVRSEFQWGEGTIAALDGLTMLPPGTPVRYCGPTFTIDGPDGERLVAVRVANIFARNV